MIEPPVALKPAIGAVGHEFASGTSMAAPNDATAAAKVLTINTTLLGAQLRSSLQKTAGEHLTGQKLLCPAQAVAAAKESLRAS